MYTTLGKEISEIKFSFTKRTDARCKGEVWCNDVMSFDVETTTAFNIDSQWVSFDKKAVCNDDSRKLREKYKKSEKLAWVYLWQFAIEDNVYYGRDLKSFYDFLTELNHYCPFKKIIWCHNLAFEFQWLQNILTFDKVFCREKRHVIYAVSSLNIEWRCSYMLTRLSLAEWAKSKKLQHKKLEGDLDYELIRTPRTLLTEKELQYGINDVLVVVDGINEYKVKYNNLVWNIPLTQTGEVRREVKKLMKSEINYRKRLQVLASENLDEYSDYVRVFSGGKTGSCYLHTNVVRRNVRCFDISSSYPFTQIVEKFPFSKFISIKMKKKYMHNDDYSYIIRFKASSITSVLYNTYWSSYKVNSINKKTWKLDNGRIMYAQDVDISMLNVDFELFIECYEVTGFELVEFKLARNDYLNNKYRRYLLELYNRKTQLKNVEGMEALYSTSKEQFNSNYGMNVTKNFTDEIIYDKGKWEVEKLSKEIFQSKNEKFVKNLMNHYVLYQHGIYIPAYGRRNLWKSVMAIDEYVLYFDTDSNKNIAEDVSFFEKYNQDVINKSNKVADDMGINRSLFTPRDPSGKVHRIGVYEEEEPYSEFKTLGAKQYCYRTIDGVLHQTVSGVKKSKVTALNDDINNFRNEFMYDELNSDKITLRYEDNQRLGDIIHEGEYDEWKVDCKYAITTTPTTFRLGMTLDYLELVLNTDFIGGKCINEQI